MPQKEPEAFPTLREEPERNVREAARGTVGVTVVLRQARSGLKRQD